VVPGLSATRERKRAYRNSRTKSPNTVRRCPRHGMQRSTFPPTRNGNEPWDPSTRNQVANLRAGANAIPLETPHKKKGKQSGTRTALHLRRKNEPEQASLRPCPWQRNHPPQEPAHVNAHGQLLVLRT